MAAISISRVNEKLKVFLAFSFPILLVLSSYGQSGFTGTVRAISTGRTTGHIANLSVTNSGSTAVKSNPQTAFIPSEGKYQSYVVYVPETVIEPKGTVVIPLQGYCADVRTPPVPGESDLPPLNTWLPVGDPTRPIADGTFNVIPSAPITPFQPGDIPRLLTSPGYHPHSPGEEGDIITTWPGSEKPVGGVVDPQKFPEVFAPLIVDVLEKINDHADVILEDDSYTTPFSGQPEKEREAVIQQTFWIYMADVTGKEYQKKDFAENVYEQFRTSTGRSVTGLPEEQKEKVDEGVDNFWNTFNAVGAEAKVLSLPKATVPELTDPDQTSGGEEDPSVLIKDEKPEKQCECGDITFELLIWDTKEVDKNSWVGVQDNLFRKTISITNNPGSADQEIKAGKKNIKKGSRQLVELKNIEINCPCIAITDEIRDAVKDLDKIERANRSKLEKAKSDLVDAEAALKAEKEKKRPRKTTITRLEKEIVELGRKINELESPITEKQKRVDDLKTNARENMDCRVYQDEKKESQDPGISVKSGSTDIAGTFDENPLTYDYKFSLVKGDNVMECRIEFKSYCVDDECKGVQCNKTIVIQVDE